MYIFNYKMFHQEASVETIKLIKIYSKNVSVKNKIEHKPYESSLIK